jgi:hypothetical protein
LRVDPEKRCRAYDGGRRCQKKKKKTGLCDAHYQRARKYGGDTRTARQRRIDKAKAMRKEIFGDE